MPKPKTTKNTRKSKSFKNIGTGILKGQPQSMAEFIGDDGSCDHDKGNAQNRSCTEPTIHKAANAQSCKTGYVQKTKPENNIPDGRLHVFIRGDLDKKLLDEVNRRKQDPTIDRKDANKRKIIEELLEKHL